MVPVLHRTLSGILMGSFIIPVVIIQTIISEVIHATVTSLRITMLSTNRIHQAF